MATRVLPKAEELYEHDFYVWTELQADLLRQRRFETLDLDNLIEEVEGLGDAKKSAVLSNPTVVIEHLLKLQFSPPPTLAAVGSTRSWSAVPGSSSTSRRACGRSCSGSWRASTRSPAGPRNADCGSTERMSPPTRCP